MAARAHKNSPTVYTDYVFLSFPQMNLTLSSPSWRKVSAEAVRPGTAFSSPWQCSFWALSSSPSNGRSISVTMPTSLGKVYPISGWESREWVWRRSEENWFWYKHFFLSNAPRMFEDWETFAHSVTQAELYFALKSAGSHRCWGDVCVTVCLSEPRGGACWITPLKAFIQKEMERKKKEIQPPNWRLSLRSYWL